MIKFASAIIAVEFIYSFEMKQRCGDKATTSANPFRVLNFKILSLSQFLVVSYGSPLFCHFKILQLTVIFELFDTSSAC